MAGTIKTASLSAPGFFGLNTQESSVTLDSGYALIANNCIIDKYGRLGARKGWSKITTSSSTLNSTNPLESLFEFNQVDGNTNYLSAGNLKLFEGTTSLTEKPVKQIDGTTNLSITFPGNRFQWASLPDASGPSANSEAYAAQAGTPLLAYRKLSGTYIFQRIGDYGNAPTGIALPDFNPDCVLSAYGRIWVGNLTSTKTVVYYSRLLNGKDFSGPGSGLLDISSVVSGDEIVALASHNNFLVIFCKNNIIIYQGANDPTTMSLSDVINGVGCIARDSVQNTGTDLVFLSTSGVRSLSRTIQEKSMPMRELSLNIRDDLASWIGSESVTTLRSAYFEREAIYLLSLPTLKQIVCFDMRNALENGSARVTLWDNLEHKAFCSTKDRKLYLGVAGGVGQYTNYQDNGSSYTMQYYTNNFDFGSPAQLKVLKDIKVTLIGGAGQSFVIKWAFDYSTVYSSRTSILSTSSTTYEYNIAEYSSSGAVLAEYSGGIVVDQKKLHAGGTGSILQIGMEAPINGSALSIQKLDGYLLLGRVT